MSATKAEFTLRARNPDVLSCIANLSSDEIFTPPEFANLMLDALAERWAEANGGADLWSDPDVTFLDPFTKSGVYLREITRRLVIGLANQFPDLQERVDHILVNQVYGIGITEITGLIARRSLYCTKFANGVHSIAKSFDSEDGNIWFERTEHTWVEGTNYVYTTDYAGNQVAKTTNGKCKYCGISQKSIDRGEGLETHAYALIHTDDVKTLLSRIFGERVHFDVIVGNPPYQLKDGGYGTSAAPIYHRFVEQAKALEPRFLSLVIPGRWFSGGKGLDTFRSSMLSDERLRVIEDFPDSNDVFPGTQIKGGVCYFLWDRDNPGLCRVATWNKSLRGPAIQRPLLEDGTDTFIRYNEAVSILRKVTQSEVGESSATPALPAGKKFSELVSSRKPFGFDTTFKGHSERLENDLVIYRNGGVGYVEDSEVTKGRKFIHGWKVFIPRAGSGSDSFPHPILGRPFVGEPGSVSSETYLCIGPFKSESEAKNVQSYIACRLFRFLVLLHKPSQDATRIVYTFVPIQDFARPWTDEELYEKYGIDDAEKAFIEEMIRPMELD